MFFVSGIPWKMHGFKKGGHVECFQWSTVAAEKVLNSEGQKVNTESAVDTAKDNSPAGSTDQQSTNKNYRV